jgi:hypothetical protein
MAIAGMKRVKEGKEENAANAGRNYSSNDGIFARFDSSPCRRSLARAGYSEFRPFLSPRHRKWRMQTGLQVARPPSGGRSGVQITPLFRGAEWRRQNCLVTSGRQTGGRMHVGLQGGAAGSQGLKVAPDSLASLAARHRERDECLSDYIGQWRFESVRSLAGDRQSGISLVIPFCRATDAGGITGRRSPHLRVSGRREGSCPSFADREVAE